MGAAPAVTSRGRLTHIGILGIEAAAGQAVKDLALEQKLRPTVREKPAPRGLDRPALTRSQASRPGGLRSLIQPSGRQRSSHCSKLDHDSSRFQAFRHALRPSADTWRTAGGRPRLGSSPDSSLIRESTRFRSLSGSIVGLAVAPAVRELSRSAPRRCRAAYRYSAK